MIFYLFILFTLHLSFAIGENDNTLLQENISLNTLRHKLLDRFQSCVCTTPTHPPLNTQSQIYIFGYGAIMNNHIIEHRNITPIFSSPAVLRDYQLLFNVPGEFNKDINEKENYANVVPSPKKCVHGVLHHVRSMEDIDKMNQFEPGYHIKKLPVTYFRSKIEKSPRSVFAHIYIYSNPAKTELRPSSRYINLILKGAEDYHFCPSYRPDLYSHIKNIS